MEGLVVVAVPRFQQHGGNRLTLSGTARLLTWANDPLVARAVLIGSGILQPNHFIGQIHRKLRHIEVKVPIISYRIKPKIDAAVVPQMAATTVRRPENVTGEDLP